MSKITNDDLTRSDMYPYGSSGHQRVRWCCSLCQQKLNNNVRPCTACCQIIVSSHRVVICRTSWVDFSCASSRTL